jgi:multidrug efflux system membrane fusion protein
VDAGNIVHANDQNGLLVITQMQPITVLFTLPEDDLASVLIKLRRGAVLPIDAYNRDKTRKLAAGRLLSADNTIDPNTGTLRLKGDFANREGTLYPNQFVNVRLLVETWRDQVIVPAVAIQRGSQGTFVYVVKPDHTAEVRPVTVSVTEAGNSAIERGLQAGEVVVTEGMDKLQPGSLVAATQAAGAPNVQQGPPAGGQPAQPARQPAQSATRTAPRAQH